MKIYIYTHETRQLPVPFTIFVIIKAPVALRSFGGCPDSGLDEYLSAFETLHGQCRS